MSGRNWNANRARELRHSRGTERWDKNAPMMAPLLERHTSQPAGPTKEQMRAETERLLGDLDKGRNG